jgi:hypothetical protein
MFRTLVVCILLFAFAGGAQANAPFHIGESAGMLEALGYISGDGVMARERPDTASRSITRLPKGSRVIVLSRSGDWYKVRLYNRAEAFVRIEFVEFRYELKDEHINENDIEKKFMVDLRNMTDLFNQTVRESMYSRSQNVMPSLRVVDGKKNGGTAIVNMIYSAVDNTGKPVPSMRENPLNDTMKKFVEIVMMKMALYDADLYTLVFRVPVFVNGKVADYKDGAVYTIERTEVDLYDLRVGSDKIWEYINSNGSAADFFRHYPR